MGKVIHGIGVAIGSVLGLDDDAPPPPPPVPTPAAPTPPPKMAPPPPAPTLKDTAGPAVAGASQAASIYAGLGGLSPDDMSIGVNKKDDESVY